MPEYSKAFIVGGWSEDHVLLEGLTREVAEGPHRIVDEAESITLAEALANPIKLNQEAGRRIVIAHSAGFMAIKEAGVIIALNGVEPTPLIKTILGGVRTGTNKAIGHDEYVTKTGLANGFLEVLRHPSTLSIPFKVQNFSTVRTMIDRKESFPGGRVYLPTDEDEFGFGCNGEVELARQNGITAATLKGWHGQPLLHPRAGAEQINRYLNEVS